MRLTTVLFARHKKKTSNWTWGVLEWFWHTHCKKGPKVYFLRGARKALCFSLMDSTIQRGKHRSFCCCSDLRRHATLKWGHAPSWRCTGLLTPSHCQPGPTTWVMFDSILADYSLWDGSFLPRHREPGIRLRLKTTLTTGTYLMRHFIGISVGGASERQLQAYCFLFPLQASPSGHRRPPRPHRPRAIFHPGLFSFLLRRALWECPS